MLSAIVYRRDFQADSQTQNSKAQSDSKTAVAISNIKGEKLKDGINEFRFVPFLSHKLVDADRMFRMGQWTADLGFTLYFNRLIEWLIKVKLPYRQATNLPSKLQVCCCLLRTAERIPLNFRIAEGSPHIFLLKQVEVARGSYNQLTQAEKQYYPQFAVQNRPQGSQGPRLSWFLYSSPAFWNSLNNWWRAHKRACGALGQDYTGKKEIKGAHLRKSQGGIEMGSYGWSCGCSRGYCGGKV